MGLHNDIAAGLADLRAFAGFVVTYSRGANVIEGLTAAPGSTPIEQVVDEESGTVLRSSGWDWLIAVADLVLDELPITPQPGDVIAFEGIEWEVRPIGSEPCFAFSDAAGTQYRIHTKQRAGQ